MVFLVVANHKYGDRAVVQIGTQVIDPLVATMSEKELQKAAETWKHLHLGTIFLKRNTVEGLNIPEKFAL